jgi:hypothetical protein
VDKIEVHQIVSLLNNIHGDICEGEVSPMQLTELYRVIRLLMDKAQGQDLKASLEYRARQYKQAIEERLGVRNRG